MALGGVALYFARKRLRPLLEAWAQSKAPRHWVDDLPPGNLNAPPHVHQCPTCAAAKVTTPPGSATLSE